MADDDFTPDELELLDEMIADLKAINQRMTNTIERDKKGKARFNQFMAQMAPSTAPLNDKSKSLSNIASAGEKNLGAESIWEQKDDQIEDLDEESLDLMHSKRAVQGIESLNNGGLGADIGNRLLQPFVPKNQQTKVPLEQNYASMKVDFDQLVYLHIPDFHRQLDLKPTPSDFTNFVVIVLPPRPPKQTDLNLDIPQCKVPQYPHWVIMTGLDSIVPLLAQIDELQLLLLAPVSPRLPPKPPDVSHDTVGFAEPSHSSFKENHSIIPIYRLLLQSLFSQSMNVDECLLTRMQENSVMRRSSKPRRMEVFLPVLVSFVLCGYAVSKEGTNIPTQSHTFQYELLTSKIATWKQEPMSHYHLTPTDDSDWEDMLPRRFLREDHQHEWPMYRKIKNLGVFSPLQGLLKEVPLQDLRLQVGSIHAHVQNTNGEYLLMLDVDRLIWSFRKTDDLPTPSTPYGGWEGAEGELRGALAPTWVSTQNGSLKEKMSAVIAGLSACQKTIGTGYHSAFPSEFFDRFEVVQPMWAPYYTIHKILAELLDQHTIAGNPRALKMVTWMVDYFYNRVLNVITHFSINRHYQSLHAETGGMNAVPYRLYSLTGDPKHLVLAHLFDKPCFLGLFAVQVNDIADFHANTHIPVVVESQMRYEVTGDQLYKEIGTFFMDLINSSHSYATGGTLISEFWHDPKRIADNLKTTENEESCTTYNMMKVSRHLFIWTKEVSYADTAHAIIAQKKIGLVAYKLLLPTVAKIHLVFHVALLKPCKGEHQQQYVSLPLMFDVFSPIVQPSKILQSRIFLRGVEHIPQILVQWEDLSTIQEDYPNFNLEDKVDFYGGGNVTNEGQTVENEVHANTVTKVEHVCGNEAIKGDRKSVSNQHRTEGLHRIDKRGKSKRVMGMKRIVLAVSFLWPYQWDFFCNLPIPSYFSLSFNS